jgi:hypothetical protein
MPMTTTPTVCAAGAALPAEAGRVTGARPRPDSGRGRPFAVDAAEMVFWGVRPACAAADGAPDGARHDQELRQ